MTTPTLSTDAVLLQDHLRFRLALLRASMRMKKLHGRSREECIKYADNSYTEAEIIEAANTVFPKEGE